MSNSLPQLRKMELETFWLHFRGQGCADFLVPEHEPWTLGLDPIDDGWFAAIGAARVLGLTSSSPRLKRIYLEREIEPEEIMLESLGRAKETFNPVHAFVAAVDRYSRQVREAPNVRHRETHARGQMQSFTTDLDIGELHMPNATTTSFPPKHKVTIEIHRMVPLLLQDTIDDNDGGRHIWTRLTFHGITVPTSAVFFASRFKRLRSLFAALKNERDGSALFRRIKRQIHGVLLAMGLYYAAIEEHRDFYFKFTQEDWLQVRLDADTYGVHDNVFGTVEYQKNQEFMNEHRDRLDKWLKEAVEWWCPDEPEVQGTESDEKRSILRECLNKTRAALVQIFAETPSQSRSLSRSRSPSALSRFSPLSRRF